MAYCTYQDVYRTAGPVQNVISTYDVDRHIIEAENIICRITKNIYWNREQDNIAATSGANLTITTSNTNWTPNIFANMYVWVYSGTGATAIRKIVSNTDDTLTVDRAWATNPDNTSYFRIFYVPFQYNPFVSDSYDGNNMSWMYLPYYPVKQVETLVINGTTLTTPSTMLYLYEQTGKIQFTGSANVSKFISTYPQDIVITYWYGVDHLPYEIKRLVELHAAIQILAEQMGGTYNAPGSVSLPDVTVSVGQQYINIRSTLQTLREEYDSLLKEYVRIYPVFG